MAAVYAGIIVAMILADMKYATVDAIWNAIRDPNIQDSCLLTMITCTISALLSVFFAVPIGYLLARHRFPGRSIFDALLDVPIVLPPLVIGLSLLILFHQVPFFGNDLEEWIGRTFPGAGVTFRVPAVILAQFVVACAFAIRTVKTTFEQIDSRPERMALTLGCNRSQAFWLVMLPQAGRGILTGGTLAWARALGEFGPILVFAGATRGRTEVLSTSVFLEINIGNLPGAVAISLLMIVLAIAVILVVRLFGERATYQLEPRGNRNAQR
jgi:molybdate transport system permease protein